MTQLIVTNRPVRDRRGSRRRPSASPLHPVLALQTTIGNAATTRLITLGRSVQREPAREIGLDQKRQYTGFAADAVELWRAAPTKTVKEYAETLLTKVNDRLIANGVPRVPGKVERALMGEAGGFVGSSWSIIIDAAGITTQPLTSPISALTEAQAAEIASTCYHEGRHAEQLWLEARLMATEGRKDAAVIATTLDLDPNTAKLAVDPALPKVPAAARQRVADWTAFRGGRWAAFWHWNENFRDFPERVSALTPDASGIEALTFAGLKELSAKVHRPVAGWQKDSYPPFAKILKDVSAIRVKDALDVAALRDVRRIDKNLTSLFANDKGLVDVLATIDRRLADKAAGTRPFTGAQAAALLARAKLAALATVADVIGVYLATNAAYRNYPHEADAYRLGDLIAQEFGAANKRAGARP